MSSYNQNREGGQNFKQNQKSYNTPREKLAREVRKVEPPILQVGITLPRNDLVHSDLELKNDDFVRQKIFEDFDSLPRSSYEHKLENPEVNAARRTIVPEPLAQSAFTLPRNAEQSGITLPRGEAAPPNINASRNTMIHEPIAQTALTLPRGDQSNDYPSSLKSSKQENTFSFERKTKSPLKLEVRDTLVRSADQQEVITLPRNPNKLVRKQTALQQSLVHSRNPARSDVGYASPSQGHVQHNYNSDVGHGYQEPHPASPQQFQNSPSNSEQYHSNHGSPQQYGNEPIYHDYYNQEQNQNYAKQGREQAKYGPATPLEPARPVTNKHKCMCMPVSNTARIVCILLIFIILALGGAAGFFLYPRYYKLTRNLNPDLFIASGEGTTKTTLTKSGDNYNVDFSIPLNLKLDVYNPLLLSKTVDNLIFKVFFIN
jgi:hypothetical protein